MEMKKILPMSIAAIFLFSPGFPYIQKLNPNPQDAPDVPFHTPIYREGKSLPKDIFESLTVGPEDGIILIHAMVTIHPSGSLTIKPGTTVAVDEYGGIRVLGNLEAKGTKQRPILFTSNELNEKNRNWSGILYEQSGLGVIEYATFHYASPSMSCSVSQQVSLQNNTYTLGNLDHYGPC